MRNLLGRSLNITRPTALVAVCTQELNGRVLALSTGWGHKLNLWNAHSGAFVQSLSFLTDEKTEASAEQKEEEDEETAEVDATAAETGEAEPVVEAEESEKEDLEGKVYDKISAEIYPMKVVTNQGLHREREVVVMGVCAWLFPTGRAAQCRASGCGVFSIIRHEKHTLDETFNSAENIQTRINRGGKRSKRADRGVNC